MARKQQLTKNLLPFLSVVIAITALLYSTWRNETTEQQRSLRQASFAVLERLTALEGHIFIMAYTDREDIAADKPFLAWAAAREIRDLAAVLPPPLPGQADQLFTSWSDHFNDLSSRMENTPASQATARKAADVLSDEIQILREQIIGTLAKFS